MIEGYLLPDSFDFNPFSTLKRVRNPQNVLLSTIKAPLNPQGAYLIFQVSLTVGRGLNREGGGGLFQIF